MYLKGELVVHQGQKTDIYLVIKRAIFLKVFVRSRLFDRGSEINEFETLVVNKYGAGKHSFTLDDINEVMVLYGQTFFADEC
jgi:hypothetical protein